ncbi:condensation domain-containing protein [Dactylosporangium sp. NPDC000521]|uniref:condensation domain-containing protein n=1 Tax=Dactylosporangium sp. NPDC000521 TaxID=3363975 RepID=UPI0036787634
MRIRVAFEGAGEGEAPLSWGQRDIWASMTRFGEQLPLGGVTPLPPGRTVGDVAAELRYLMSRYQVLRTRLRFGDDGTPRQLVAAGGTATLEVLDTDGAAADPQAEADRMLHRFRRDPIDFTSDWPIRMGVVRHAGRLTHLCAVIWHIAMDRSGAAVMLREVAARVQEPVAGMQPLEQAGWQASEAGARQSRSALRHWERVLRAMPPPWPRSSRRRERPRHWKGRLVSPAIPLATRVLAERTGADPSTTLLAGFAVAVRRCAGVDPVPVLLVTSNRFRPGLADVVAPVAQPGLCLVDVADAPFEQVVAGAHRAATAAYKHAYYDTASKESLVARVAAERGPQFRVDFHLNDRRGPVPPSPGRGSLREAVARRTLDWAPLKDTPSSRLFVHADDDGPATALTCYADTHHLSLAEASTVLTTLEIVLTDAALHATG